MPSSISPSHLADEDQAVTCARYRTADVDQVALGIDLLDAQVQHGLLRGAHLPRQLLALDHARRVRARPERARVALERVTVRCRPAREAVPLHDALETAPLRVAGDPDLVARRELLDRQRLTDLIAFGRVHAELAQQRRCRLQARLPGVTERSTRRAMRLALAPAELQRSLAIAVLANLHHRAGTGLDHRHGHRGARVAEDLGHAQLASNDSSH